MPEVFAGMPSLPGVTHRQVTVRGFAMHVAEVGPANGAGEPLLLVHGWPQHWWCWHRVLPELARHYRVIAPDLRGMGWSEAPATGYDKENLADDLLALLDALNLPRVRMIGHDWGGWTGFLLAQKAPQRVSRFVALSIPHPWQHGRPLTWQLVKRLSYQIVMATPWLGTRVWRLRPGEMRRQFNRAIFDAKPWTKEAWSIYFNRFRDSARAWASSQLYRQFLLHEAPAIRKGRYAQAKLPMPVLHLVGERDPVCTPSALAGYENHAPHLTLKVIPQCGHFLPEERPEVLLEQALPFLAAQG